MQIPGRLDRVGDDGTRKRWCHGSRCKLFTGLSLVAGLFLFWGLLSAATAAGLKSLSKDGKQPWRVAADELKYDRATDQYIGKGNVSIARADTRLTADFVRFDQKTMHAFARGHVVLSAGEDIVSGESVAIDLNTETGTIYNGTIFYQKKHFYIRGKKIEKVGPETFTGENVSITTCDGPSPAWRLTGSKVKLTREGFGSVSNAAMWIKGVPVLWAPYLLFPTKRERQSGFLLPEFDQSDRLGFQYIQPFFWAINDNSDATFYGQVFSKRGFKVGGEYRYMRDEFSKGTLMADYWRDSEIDDGQGANSTDWGYTFDNVLRTNKDRYWVRGKADQRLPFGFTSTVDVDVVSDQDYLREIRDQMTGYYDTRDAFLKTFGRDLDDYDDPVRVNQLDIRRNWDKFSLESAARWNDDTRLRNSDTPDTTLQYLPFVSFQGSKQELFGRPNYYNRRESGLLNTSLYYQLTSTFNYFYREEGQAGLRGDLYPQLFLPLRYKGYFTFEPSVGLRGTAYHMTQFGDDEIDQDQARGIYDIGADLKTEVFRIFEVGGERVERLKHQFRPRVVYGYTPKVDQEDLPDFDGIDRIGKRSLLTYSLTNTLTAKIKTRRKASAKKKELQGQGQESAAAKETAQEEDDPWNYEYRRVLWFYLAQSYDFNDGDDGFRDTSEDEDYIGPFAPVHAELELTPFKYLALQGDADLDVYEGDFIRNGLGLRLSDYRRDRLYVEHRRKKDDYHSIYTSLVINVNDKLWLNGLWEHDLEAEELVRAGGGFLYQAQCWAFRMTYTTEQEEDRLTFRIDLTGIGGFGKSIGVRGTGQENSIVQ